MPKNTFRAVILCMLLALLPCVCTGCGSNTPDTPPVPPTPSDTEDVQHSPLYLPDVSVEDVLRYFSEVCLDAEITNSGNPNRLQRWDTPIYYWPSGAYTDADLTVLDNFASWLNTIEGFPGIHRIENPLQANLHIYFCLPQEMISQMGDWTENLDGAVTFYYNNDSIYQATICCRSDIDQQIRNSVILEEIYNGLGPIQDTDLRSDSIIFSGYSTPQHLTAVDELLLRLLYHPQLTCGMDSTACQSAIRQLYY